ncbi:odv-e56 [Tomelloso virus]|uniref:Odv-e56 n=1 Tax=Tomelloso virus TaxID=2053981 RepID=A0A2H4T2V2_9VIRU|nr:odv-e56 [Tomelloso virus]ATY70199.1 odv-e56 [Tomelloso virus]
MAPLPIKSFLKDLKSLAKATVSEAEELVKGFKSDIKSLDEVVTTLTPSKNKYGFIELSENQVGLVNEVMRQGDLRELIRISAKDIPFTSADSKAFKTLVADTPELKYKDVTDTAASNKKSYPQLNLTEAEIPNMSKTAAKDVKKVENNLFKYFKKGTTIALTLGAVYVAVDWLTKTTEKRKGCFMLTTLNNKTTSCKVQAYSCIGSGGDLCTTSLNYYNTTLVLIKVATLDDTNELKIKVAAAAKVNVSDVNANLAKIIDNSYEAVDAVISSATTKPSFTICEITHPDVEKGVVPSCRMCTPSDNPISTTYIDPSQYPDNVTFNCVINPSLLDTIADAAINTGKDLLSGVSSGLMTLLKPLLIVAVVIIVLIIVATIGLKVIKGLGEKKPAPPQQYATQQPMQV